MKENAMDPTRWVLPRWTPLRRRGPPWARLWLAGLVVAGCTLAGLRARCGALEDIPFVALAWAIGLQLASAGGSFVMILVACLRRDWGRAGVEAFICLCMLLAIPLALFALMSSLPECSAAPEGG